MICKIYDENSNELLSFEMLHFSERLIDGGLTLSCVFSVESGYNDESLEKFESVSKATIGKIQFLDENTIVGEYLKYRKINSIAVDYSPGHSEGVILFRK